MIRVVLPPHLRTLARVSGEVEVEVGGEVTQRRVVDAGGGGGPMLGGTAGRSRTMGVQLSPPSGDA